MAAPETSDLDAEALLEPAAGGSAELVRIGRPLRALGASVLGLVACAAALRSRRRAGDALTTKLDGLVEKDAAPINKFRVGVFIAPTIGPEECWTVGGEGGLDLLVGACDPHSEKQLFEQRDWNTIVWGDHCLTIGSDQPEARFTACDRERRSQTFQLPQRGDFGVIGNCACTIEDNCRVSCQGAPALATKQDNSVMLRDAPAMGTTFQIMLEEDRGGDNSIQKEAGDVA